MERVSILVNKEVDLPLIYKEDLNTHFNFLLTKIRYPFSPFKTNKENLMKLIEFMSEVGQACEEKRFITRMGKLSKYCQTIRDEEMLLQFYYNLLLGVENKSLLTGFGFSNKFGDHMKGDPERQSIYT